MIQHYKDKGRVNKLIEHTFEIFHLLNILCPLSSARRAFSMSGLFLLAMPERICKATLLLSMPYNNCFDALTYPICFGIFDKKPKEFDLHVCIFFARYDNNI